MMESNEVKVCVEGAGGYIPPLTPGVTGSDPWQKDSEIFHIYEPGRSGIRFLQSTMWVIDVAKKALLILDKDSFLYFIMIGD